MKTSHILVLVLSLLLFSFQTPNAIEVRYGKLENVLVALSGDTDSTFVTEFIDNWFARGPNALDVDKDGNIYILDWRGEKVVKFDKEGKFLLSFTIPGAPGFPGTWPVAGIPGMPESQGPTSEIAVDNSGNVYVTTGNTLKFSPDGAFLFRLHDATLQHVAVDAHGRFYNFADELSGVVDMYSAEGEHRARMHHDFEYPDRVMTQKEAGDDIYFRVGKYLMKTTLEDFLETDNLDTVAILPNKLRLLWYKDEGVDLPARVPPPPYLIGVDKNNCFYFHSSDYLQDVKMLRFCESHTISRWSLYDGELNDPRSLSLFFLKGKDGECTYKGLWDFAKGKQFVVAGDGTIYFLHGTVDTIKVSKLTID